MAMCIQSRRSARSSGRSSPSSGYACLRCRRVSLVEPSWSRSRRRGGQLQLVPIAERNSNSLRPSGEEGNVFGGCVQSPGEGNESLLMPDYEAVIGLETPLQLNTHSKIFCACKADSWGDPPNTNICPVCTGLPGVLPVLNRAAVEKAVRLAAAVGAKAIHDVSYFARKNYFYPDLPKGYQISQYDEPLASGGGFELPLPDGTGRHVSIWKLHLEEDAGKTVHQGRRRLIDFNRCGVPLIEMVTGPDLRSADEAAQYLIRLRQLLRWLGTSEADMERGQLRCDGNVSLRPAGSTLLAPKTEIKNVNSIENLRAAIDAELARHRRELEPGGRGRGRRAPGG